MTLVTYKHADSHDLEAMHPIHVTIFNKSLLKISGYLHKIKEKVLNLESQVRSYSKTRLPMASR